MAQPDINATYRSGSGYLSTTFSDPSDIGITHWKWIFGDGVVIEGGGIKSINHTYYTPGEYDVTLVATTGINQYSVTKTDFIVIDTYRPIPDFIISQSYDIDTGNYWKLYFDQDLFIVFEDNDFLYRSKNKVAIPGKWIYITFDRNTRKMKVGSFSYYLKEIELIILENLSPMSFSSSGTDILPNSTMKIDEFRIWSISKDTMSYYTENRGRAGYLDTL